MSRQVTILTAFFLGVLILGSIGSFLLYVPAISWISVTVVLAGMVLMFLLGVQAGARRIRITKRGIHIPAEWVAMKRRIGSQIGHARPL
ncbi:MAG TPA: hypothetical protein VKR43_13610 [Bryobacteraceae bacterium]|jgi:hypothetical protein|nr:hypothetical protein [Bryobacteraceae bacterium]